MAVSDSTALSTRCILLAGAVLVLLVTPMCPTNDHSKTVCKSVDIRNSIRSFENLRGCRVVEGFVQILLFDNVNESLFANISFPELREITDFLLLYRVNGLRSLATLFPNLAVIRGQNTFYNHAFIVFEMPSLQEIGLYSLTDIMNGYIRIDKNPSLCYLNTINWDLIAHEKGDHFIRNTKPESECPLCPGDNVDGERPCPRGKHIPGKSASYLEGQPLCWNRYHCQKVCPDNCSTCNGLGECCDPKCLGGCSRDDPKSCHVCKNFTIFDNSNNMQCLNHCPDGYFEFLDRRCVTKEECFTTKRPIDATGDYNIKLPEYPFKIFNKTCILHCPPNYVDDYQNKTCKKCEGRCKKVCPGANLDNEQSVEELRGCTHINGSLEIQIRGGKNIVNKLEENLNMIEEIDGYIKVVRSFPLMTLNFLKNLKVIHGNVLESNKYVFVVLDNQNLQDLFDWENRTLRIDQGKLFFHFNPKLCISKIVKLQEEAKIDNFTDFEVAPNSNGDKTACHVEDLEVTVFDVQPRSVVLRWRQFAGGDYRKLLGYVVYCIEAPHQNVTVYDGRDACSADGWKVDDVQVRNGSQESHFLSHLRPYTQYAYYVSTYTLVSEKYSAQSKIGYFRTLPFVPSKPQSVKISSGSSDNLYITWEPPEHPNGNVTHYIITGNRTVDKRNNNLGTDWCKQSFQQENSEPYPEIETKNQPKNDTCVCTSESESKLPKRKEESDILSIINFENAIHNTVYKKKKTKPSLRRKREVPLLHTFPNETVKHENEEQIENRTVNGIRESFKLIVYNKEEINITDLHHYSRYRITLQACRKSEGEHDKEPKCSESYIPEKYPITRSKVGADKITGISVNTTSTMAHITWREPSDPNGEILTYEIEYTRKDIENAKPFVDCITQAVFIRDSKTYKLKLNPGNYSLRIAAKTQAGMGEHSPYVYFLIEESSTSATKQIVGFIFLVLCLLALPTGYYLWKRQKERHNNNMKLIPSINPDYVSTVYIPDEWEVPRKKIELLNELGQGSFGMVYEGIASDIRGKAVTRCAIKTVNEHATNRERIEFLNEAAVMKAFDTHHVVRLLGVVSQGQPTLVVMELMVNGDLKSYLRSHRPDAESYDPNIERQPPTLKRILQMAIEIADGMAYLAAKKFVHRDLAARNCMVAEDLTVKIGDFGMTRDIYETDYYRKGTKGLLPVRWMAPESLKDGVFTSSSDVWSYGVVLWEMATLASQPYQGLSNDQVLRYVIDGGVMEMPENCPDKLYKLMRNCWRHKPSDRPRFLELCTFLLDDVSPNFSQVSFYHSAAGMEARASKNSQSSSQDDPSTPLRNPHDLDENFSINSSDHDSDLDIEIDGRIDFPSFPTLSKEDSAATANGYVTGHPTNGAPM